MYAARHIEDHNAINVITGTFIVNIVPYFALIDIGSSHSYVTDKLGVKVKDTISNIIIFSPLGQSVSVSKVYKRCPLEIQGAIFLVDLMELPFDEFDLILRMDWLVEYQVILDCATKRVTLKTLEGKEILMVGECRDYLSNVISTLVDEKLVRKGCKAYLAYILDTKVSEPTIESICTLKDYPNDFLEELPGLTPECEVKLGIELQLGVTLVSITLYRITPKELVELKA